MSDINISDYLPILSIGLWVGISITFISKMISFVITLILGWFRKSA